MNNRKIRINVIVFFLVAAFLCYCRPASALFNIFKFGTVPVVGVPVDASDVPHTVESGIGQAKTVKTQVSDVKTNIWQAIKDRVSNLFTGKASKKTLPGTTEIVESDFVNIYSEAEIYKRVYELFYTFPSSDLDEQRCYRKLAALMYKDVSLEAYTVARELDTRLNGEIRLQVESLSTTLVEGGDGADPADNNNSTYNNNYNAYQAIDSILAVIQEVTAIKAQLAAAKAMKNEIQPVYTPKTSWNFEKGLKLASRDVRSSSQQLAFAQIRTPNAPILVSGKKSRATSLAEEYLAKEEVAFDSAPVPEETVNPAGDKLAELEKIEPVHDKMRKALDAHNLIKQLGQFKNIQKQYKQVVERHEQMLKNLKKADDVSIIYLSRYYSDPMNAWSGIDLGSTPNEHSLRKGISGWSVNAFELVKAAEVSPVQMDDFRDINYDESLSSSDINSVVPQGEKISEQEVFFKEPSKEEKYEENARAIQLIKWNVGAKAAQLLADEQSKWGKVSKPFSVWNDVKSFYGQYLNGKYNNIADYLEAVPNSEIKNQIAKALNDDKLKRDGQDEASINARALDKIAELAKVRDQKIVLLDNQLDEKRKEIEASRSEALRAADADYAQKLKGIRDNRAQATAELDNLVAKIDASKADLKKQQSQLHQLQTVQANLENNLSLAKEEDKAAIQEKISGNAAEISKTQGQISSLQNAVAAEEKSVTSQKAKIASFDEQEVQESESYQSSRMGIDKSHDSQLVAASSARNEAVAVLESEFSNAQREVEKAAEEEKAKAQIVSTQAVEALLEMADTLINQGKSQIRVEVEKTIKQLRDQGESTYISRYHPAVVRIHQQLIERLKAITVQVKSIVDDNVMLSVAIFREMLLNADTSPDTEYFVGTLPLKERVLRAPYKAPQNTTVPLREVFHFDETDWKNLTARGLTKENFFSNGSAIPDIWKLMLSDKPYVEADFDLQKALNLGSEAWGLYRGGTFPCNTGEYDIDVDPDAGYRLLSLTPQGWHPCQQKYSVSVRKTFKRDADNPMTGRTQICSTVRNEDMKATAAETCFYEDEPPAANSDYSELGVFLNNENGKLSLRQPLNNLYSYLKKMDDEYSDGSRTDETEAKMSPIVRIREAWYKKAPFSVNQIGEFLDAVEAEIDMRKARDELAKTAQKNQEDLIRLLQELGYNPDKSFDLTNADDYNLIRGALDNIKNKNVTSAVSEAAAIDSTGNELVEEEVSKIKKILGALQLDKDELTVLNESSSRNPALEESIKTQSVNQTVEQKYEETADETLEKLNEAFIPYCGAY